MKKLLLPLVMMFAGVGGGVGAGLFLFPPSSDDPHSDVVGCLPPEHDSEEADHVIAPPSPGGVEDLSEHEYARLNNQFVVPVVEQGKVAALVVMSLSVEVTAGAKETVYQAEPKLRDSILQVLFNHANLGGFEGAFTTAANMRDLRGALREAAHAVLGDLATDVLIIDIVRQDI